jgi:hypothetical protein
LTPFGNLDIYYIITKKKGLKETGQESMVWIHLGQDKPQWQVLMNTIMNLWVS